MHLLPCFVQHNCRTKYASPRLALGSLLSATTTINYTLEMALRQHPLSHLHLALPSSITSPISAFYPFTKAHCRRFPLYRSCHRCAVRIKERHLTASLPAQIKCNAKGERIVEGSEFVKDKSVSVLLLAGGKGKRMGVNMPKQYLPLLGKPIALYSLYTFSELIEVREIVVVCDPSYQDIFKDANEEIQLDIKFALPGKERQDSVFNGLQEVDGSTELVCIHDSARPLVSSTDIKKVLKDGWLNGAAVLGVPVKATIKEANRDSFVIRTLDRKTLWEMQTPQVIKPDLLKAGFELVNREGLEVTDDVSIVEHLSHPVYITEGSYTNIKVTTPDDLLIAERILSIE